MFSRTRAIGPRAVIILALASVWLSPPATAGADARTQWLERLAGEMRHAPGIRAPFPCDDGWLATSTGYVVDVTSWAERAGLHRGDHLLAFGGVPVAQAGNWGETLARLTARDSLALSVQRAGREVAVTLPCRDNQERSRAQREILDAIMAERWDDCIAASRRLGALGDHPFSVALFFQWNCGNEKLKAESAEGPGPIEFWQLYYELHSRRLEDARHYPGGLQERGPEILKAISTLEKREHREWAGKLRRQLYEAIPGHSDSPR
jgi:hypothetical protein